MFKPNFGKLIAKPGKPTRRQFRMFDRFLRMLIWTRLDLVIIAMALLGIAFVTIILTGVYK